MRSILFLAAFIGTVFFLSSCPSGGGGSSSGGGTSPNNPPGTPTLGQDGMKWLFVDPQVPVLNEPVFDGNNFIGLGFDKQTSAAGFTGYSDGTSDAYVYESLDGVSWQKTYTLKNYGYRGVRNSWGKNDENDVVVLGNQTYLRQEEPKIDFTRGGKILKRNGRGDWSISTTPQPSVGDFELVGPAHGANGPYYVSYTTSGSGGGYLYQSLNVPFAGRIPITYDDSDSLFKIQSPGGSWGTSFLGTSFYYTNFYVFNNKVFRLVLGETPYNAATGSRSSYRALLFQAPVGVSKLTLVKNFPSFIEPPGGILSKNSARLYMASNEKDAYVLGVGSTFWSSADEDVTGYGPRFYKSSDSENWQEITEMARFSKYFDLKKGNNTNVYELGAVSYVKDLFVLFVVERYYFDNSAVNTWGGRDYHTTACHIITSKDLVRFYEQTYPNVDCERAKAFYSNGKYIFTMKLEDGRALRGDAVAEQMFRLGIITATP